MYKTIKFKPHFVEQILKQEKLKTTRLFDDKDLAEGDIVDFINKETGEKFAEAKITQVTLTTFEKLISDLSDKDETYERYKGYYNRDILPTDEVKIIDFELLK